MGWQPVSDPLMDTELTTAAPPTLVIKTRLNYQWPLIVNLITLFEVVNHMKLACEPHYRI